MNAVLFLFSYTTYLFSYPILSCDGASMKNPCAKKVAWLTKNNTRLSFVPRCTENGWYYHTQCKDYKHTTPETCWCVSPLNGKILRQFVGNHGSHETWLCPQCLADQSHALPPAGVVVGYVPRCNGTTGNYKPIQKNSKTGETWCVNEIGFEVPDSRIPAGTKRNHTCE